MSQEPRVLPFYGHRKSTDFAEIFGFNEDFSFWFIWV